MQDKEKLITDIKEWIKLAKEIDKVRKVENCDIIFKISPVERFEDKIAKLESDKKVEEAYLDMFTEYCQGVIDSAVKLGKGYGVSESFTSLSKTCYLMDLGFAIVSDIMTYDYSKAQKKDRFDLSVLIGDVYKFLLGRRKGVYNFIDPFNDIYTDLEESAKYAQDGYKIIELFGLSSDFSTEEYAKMLDEEFTKRENDFPNIVVRDFIYQLLKNKNLSFEISITEDEQVLFEKIGKLIPEFRVEEYSKEFVTEKEFTRLKFKLFGENVELDIPYSGGDVALIEMLNPLIEKKLGKTIVGTDRSGYIYVVVPHDKKNELLANPLFFEQMN